MAFLVPKLLGDIDANLLIPDKVWQDQGEYRSTAIELVKKFQKNFEQYDLGDSEVRNDRSSFGSIEERRINEY